MDWNFYNYIKYYYQNFFQEQAEDSARTTVEIMLHWAQLSAGIATPILEDHSRLPYLEGSWIPNV
eukprot:12498137-Ditylum_brightwellii.AAC.1